MNAEPPGKAPQLALEIADCAQATAAMLGDFGRGELADAVQAHAARPLRDNPIVVVVGETKRGKSSLVNALLGRPGLSPVDVEVATLVHITFRYAETPMAQAFIRGQREPIDINVDELFDWACELGNPGNEKGVTAIEVRLPVPMLRSLTLIDTPGVGGLELGHGELTLQALASADAVLFVVDAGAPISKTELTFLARAAERIDTVALILTKIDAHPQWRQIQSDDLELLRVHMPQVAVASYPVSNLNAERALLLGDSPDGNRERHRSGLNGVAQVLSEYVANRAHLLWGANTMRFCMRAVAEMKQLAGQQLAIADADPALSADLEAEQALLAKLSPAEAVWRAQLNASLAQLQNDRSHQLRKQLEELKAKYDKLAKECGDEVELQQLAGQFMAAVDAAIAQLAQDTASKMVDDVIGAIDVIADDTSLRDTLSRIGAGAAEDRPKFDLDGLKKRSAQEIHTQVMPVMGIHGLVGLLVPGVGTIASLAVGGAAAMLLAKERKKLARQTAFADWTQRYIGAVREDDTHTFIGRYNDAQVQLVGALEAGIKRRGGELTAARERLRARMSETQSQRATAVDLAHQQLAGVDTLSIRLQKLLAVLQQQRAADTPPADKTAQLATPS